MSSSYQIQDPETSSSDGAYPDSLCKMRPKRRLWSTPSRRVIVGRGDNPSCDEKLESSVQSLEIPATRSHLNSKKRRRRLRNNRKMHRLFTNKTSTPEMELDMARLAMTLSQRPTAPERQEEHGREHRGRDARV
ncbi:Uncharacterized protein Rs2_18856 [Raphanus sativus]|nr:Uncharacterized protein Rs2_18856 [Raphanus sativus]